MAICNGDCDCHPKPARACPCEDAVNACLARGKMPNCENKAYIPWITLPNLDAAKNVFNSLVQISENNTLYYIGCDQRVTKLVANPVEIDNYDLENNPNNLRSQFVIDFANNRGAYYNETGEYQIFYFGEHGGGDEPITLRMNYPTDLSLWSLETPWGGETDCISSSRGAEVTTAFFDSSVSFTNESTSQTYTPEEVATLLEGGAKIIFDNVPLGWAVTGREDQPVEFSTIVNGVEISGPTTTYAPYGEGEVIATTYSGNSMVLSPRNIVAPLGTFLIKTTQGDVSVGVQGFDHIPPS